MNRNIVLKGTELLKKKTDKFSFSVTKSGLNATGSNSSMTVYS